MEFKKVQFSGGINAVAYQVIQHGIVTEYRTEQGEIVDLTSVNGYECQVIVDNPSTPTWANEVEIIPGNEQPSDWPTWTAVDFIKRFTEQEYRAIMQASLSSPDVLGLTIKLSINPLVYAANEEVNYGLSALVGLGILTSERKTEILGGYEG